MKNVVLPSTLVLASLLGLCATSTAHAQYAPVQYGAFIPTTCDMTDANAQYGAIAPGAQVQLAMHTPWRGDANWSPEMGRYVGMSAIVTQLGGVDSGGCPTVRVNVDNGQYYWRIRDMRLLGAAMPARPAMPAGDPIPRYCGMRGDSAQFGAIQPGTTVVLGAHTFAGAGDDLNWNAEMQRWVGVQSVITSLEGVDDYGCPVVRTTSDGGQYYWRIRDMQLVGGMAVAPPPPVAATIPTWCGQPSGAPQYGPLRPGSWVVLGMHTADVGDPNWSPDMGRWVGQQTTVTGFSGTDSQGCPTVRVAADGGNYAWRIRNMTFLR
ncbi:MAG: hypothetical protein J0L92_24715 [Deltaproteobacteria bacterium]|nr:hypothetical protein [Deltaproteobacteria bacterium]